MSRAFTPPSTMSQEDVKTVADVRRDIWTNAFTGMGIGSLIGVVGHTAAHIGNKQGMWKLPLNRNTLFLSIMLGFSSGSFIMATTTGKNEVHKLHPVFELGKRKSADSYQETIKRAKADPSLKNRSYNTRRKDELFQDNEVSERAERERNRLFRRKTLEKTLQSGRGGLSDAHGGHWINSGNQK